MTRTARASVVPMRIVVLLSVVVASSATWGQQELKVDFVTGKARGELQVAFDKAEIEKEGEQHHLAIHPGGNVQVTFDTKGRRGEVLFEIVARTTEKLRVPQPVAYSISVNDEMIQDRVEFNFDVYTSTGYDVSRKIIRGKNTVKLNLLPASKGDLWLREISVEVGHGGWSPWLVLAGSALLSILFGRWFVFRVLWMGGRGIDPLWATRIAIIFIVVVLFLAYLHLFGATYGFTMSIAVGGLLFILLLVLLAFTRA